MNLREDLYDPIAWKLEALLASFNMRIRLDESRALKHIVLESPVRSGYLVPQGSNRDQDRLITPLNLLIIINNFFKIKEM